MSISIPQSPDQYAAICLGALKNSPVGKFISLGGAVGLSLYHEYRASKDVEAWWTPEAAERDKQLVIDFLNATLDEFGNITIRRFGDVVSLDLQQESKIVFNFQIANRSALLRPTVESPWEPVTLDSMDDLVASKMSALIERGAPRDFLDIYEICNQDLITISRCWALWQEREIKRGVAEPDQKIGYEALVLHLSRIERSRPLEKITDSDDRNHAKNVREWFKNEFCKGKIQSN
jgi:hypothetical protein